MYNVVGMFHRVHIERRLPLSGVHSIMMEIIPASAVLLGGGGGGGGDITRVQMGVDRVKGGWRVILLPQQAVLEFLINLRGPGTK